MLTVQVDMFHVIPPPPSPLPFPSPHHCAVSSPLDPHKSALISLLVPVIRGREQSLVEAGLDLCCALLSLPSYLENKEVRV